ncbi:MAG: hypothetical protein ABJA32_03450 [Ginsengibacter sp.]
MNKNKNHDWNHLIDYSIPEKNVVFDGLTAGQYSANIRFAYVIKLEGTYLIEFRLPDAVRKQ